MLFLELLAKIEWEWVPRNLIFIRFISILTSQLLTIIWTKWNYVCSSMCVVRLRDWYSNSFAFKIKTNESKFENKTERKKIDWKILGKIKKMSFGPQLPAHLQKPPQESDSESDDDQSYGPRLPSVACRGPKPAQDNSG